MSTSLLVQLNVVLSLSSLITGIVLFLRRRLYFKRQKRFSMDISKVIKEINRMLIQYITDDAEPLREEVKTTPQKENFVQINKLLRRVDVELAKQDWEAAEKLLIEALALGPDHEEVCKKLALLYLHQEKYSKAETLYLQLVEEESKDASIYGNLGIALYSQGKLDSAIKAYERAIELEPSKASRYISLGQIYLDQENIKAAIEYFNLAIKKDPKNIDYLFTLARVYKMAELYEQSRHTVEQILHIEPYNEEAKLELQRIRSIQE